MSSLYHIVDFGIIYWRLYSAEAILIAESDNIIFIFGISVEYENSERLMSVYNIFLDEFYYIRWICYSERTFFYLS